MELVLKRKGAADDKDPLLVILEDKEKKTKETKKIMVGETIEVSDDVGYELLAKYKGMFVQKTAPTPMPDTYETKTLKAKVQTGV